MVKIIFHFGGLAGRPYVLANGFRDRGYRSINVIAENSDRGGATNSLNKSNRQLPYDRALSITTDIKFKKLFDRIKFVIEVIIKGSIIHYHGGTILPYNLDALVFKLFKIPTVISWGGGDSRIIEKAVKANPYYYRYEEPQKDKKIIKMLKRLSKFNVAVATDPEMSTYSKPYFKKIFIFKAPINLNTINCVFPDIDNRVVFLHIPTHPFAKGTIHICNAVKKLKKENLQFEFKLIESNLTQKQVKDQISKCDVYVDELRVGSYGITAIEAMASGKPTMTYIREDILYSFPNDLPIVNTNPDTIYDNLKDLILNPDKRVKIGKESRYYVEKYHNVDVVVENLLDIYSEIGFSK